MWLSPGTLSVTAPPGAGWTAYVELSLRKPDGRRFDWTQDLVLLAESVEYTVSAHSSDDGTVSRLVARVVFEAPDGSVLRSSCLAGRFVVADSGRYIASEERFASYIIEGGFVDPHDTVALDEEMAR